MNAIRYIKSFSKGQITIPKEFRDIFGINGEFWLKVYIDQGKIIAEPIKHEEDKDQSARKLLNMGTEWFDIKELKKNRQQIENQIKKRRL